MDTVGAGAVDIAREAAVADAGSARVGEHLEVLGEGPRVVTHLFECTDPAYRGWRWSVTVARPPRARSVTVDEVVLVSGPESVVAPEWVPFGERLRADDLGVGDVIPADPEDPRLVPAYTEAAATGVADTEEVPWDLERAWEPGVGRIRVLSVEGRELAAERWQRSERGPSSAMARYAKFSCSSCGFMVPLSGPLGLAFGVCANELSPGDGHVVAMDFGCGAHSESVALSAADVSEVVLDETGFDLLDMSTAPASAEAESAEDAQAKAEAESAEDAQAKAEAEAATADAAEGAAAEGDSGTAEDESAGATAEAGEGEAAQGEAAEVDLAIAELETEHGDSESTAKPSEQEES